ncbi:MAG: cupin domain-containing protein [Halofilum sp. (in: g-proteobacteria)]|nr:cupin domain-containing protein [Halofilum sp. (in: g-proteobacteria)]
MTGVGARLRNIRTQHGLSQRELARRAGVTHASISLIESERVSPSIASLKKVLDGLPMSLAEFFTLDIETPRRVFYRADELPDVGSGDIAFHLVGAERQQRAMTVLHEVYQPGADTGETMLVHDGEEGGVVVRGEIELTVAGDSRRLGPGDGYYFESRLPHRFRNPGDEPCEIISANAPPSL